MPPEFPASAMNEMTSAPTRKRSKHKRADTSGLITRAQLAIQLGVSESEIKRRERLGKLTPVMRGDRNQPFYRPPLTMRSVTVNTVEKVDYEAIDAKRVLILLKQNKPMLDIVLELEMHPATVHTIMHDLALLDGALVIPGHIMKILNKLDLDGNFPLTTPEDLLDVLQGCVDKSCSNCGRHPKMVCKFCVPSLAQKLDI